MKKSSRIRRKLTRKCIREFKSNINFAIKAMDNFQYRNDLAKDMISILINGDEGINVNEFTVKGISSTPFTYEDIKKLYKTQKTT